VGKEWRRIGVRSQGYRLALSQRERGITQAALAVPIGILSKTVNEICRAKRGVSDEMAVKLSIAWLGSYIVHTHIHRRAMATKTISIDTEAYGRLKARKAEGESFSETIKRIVPKPFDVEKWLDSMAADPVGEEFVAAVEETVAQRRSPQNMTAHRSHCSGE
jgi:predicted CopG family antitoxin/DNA-binding XRE family transcriptional regulator